jgi:hypothetical protein
MNSDLTIIFLTLNLMPESWVRFQLEHLVKSADGARIISISRVPMSLGDNVLQTEPRSYWNIYMQLLRGAHMATTPYVAMAEDDVLYTPNHFSEFRPKMDEVSYDHSRWSLFTWDNMYCMRQRINNSTMIGPREYVIDALEERKARWPQGLPDTRVGEIARPDKDRLMRVSPRKMFVWYCRNPVVQLTHESGTDSGNYPRVPGHRRLIKKHGQMKAYDIPYWGKASEVLKHYRGD